MVGARTVTHGHKANGRTTREYSTWRGMIQRCEDPNFRSYPSYGGRGVRVCPCWRNSFEAFLADMGEKPRGASIERVNVNGDYEPGNCRWATPREQARNRRTNRRVLLDGVIVPLIEACERTGLNYRTIRQRASLKGLPFSVVE